MSISSKNKIAFRLLSLVFFMLAMSFAAVPFYDWFCRVTGFGGVTQTAVDESDEILDRNITVRFDGSLDSNIDWEFKPTQRKMTLRIGARTLEDFRCGARAPHCVLEMRPTTASPDQATLVTSPSTTFGSETQTVVMEHLPLVT